MSSLNVKVHRNYPQSDYLCKFPSLMINQFFLSFFRRDSQDPFDFNKTSSSSVKDEILEIQRQQQEEPKREEFRFAEPRSVSCK